MKTILKIVIMIMSVSMIESFLDKEFYTCSFLSLLLFLTILYELLIKIISVANCEFTIDEPCNVYNKVSDYELDYLNGNGYNIPYEHRPYVPTNNTIVTYNDKTIDELISERKVKEKKITVLSKVDAPTKDKPKGFVNKIIGNLFNTDDNKEVKEEKKEEKPKETKAVAKKTVETKSSETKANYIIFRNEKGVNKSKTSVYNDLITLLKDKKYSTSKICRMLQAMPYINILSKTIIIYTNERQLDTTDIIPKKEIIEHFKNKHGLKVQFIKINSVSIFDYYVKTDLVC